MPASVSTVPVCLRREEDDDVPSIGPGNASYTRYSSDLQTDRSIADQQRKCRDRATRDGNEISPDLEFVDEAISGAKHDRAGFEALMTAARASRMKTAYFENLSRLARDCVLTLQTLRELVYVHKVRIVSIDEGIDSAVNDSWELLAAIFGMQNEQYLRALAKFVFRGQEGVVLDRLCVGDYCFGYKSEPIPGSEQQRRGRHPKPKKRYIIKEVEAAWVKLIFDWFVNERRSLNWIARELTRLKAPKDHRASTKAWRHQQLLHLLTNRKYIGWWPWGEMQNVRDPMTGKIRQEPRPAAEIEKYLRHFPELGLIDDDTFAKAGEILRKSAEAMAECRRPKKDKKTGRHKLVLAGSSSEVAENYPRHLLSGLIECGDCGRKFYVGGKNSGYMFCPNYQYGACSCQTTLRRDLAEELILTVIAEEILADLELMDWMVKVSGEAWLRDEQALPSELQAKEQALAEVLKVIDRLIDRCEQEDVPELNQRLLKRRAERDLLQTEVDRLRRRGAERSTAPPSREWIESQLQNLRALLSTGSPAAAHALRALIDGRIVVTEIREPGKSRHYLQGRFCIKLHDLAKVADVSMGEVDHEAAVGLKEVVIDFRKAQRHVELADPMKAYLDADKTVDEVLEKFGCSYTLFTRAMNYWYDVRGLQRPDGRGQRGRLKGRRASDMLQAEIMALWHAEELQVQEIADALGCGLESVREAVVAWHEKQGLPVPDGRARRKAIRLKK